MATFDSGSEENLNGTPPASDHNTSRIFRVLDEVIEVPAQPGQSAPGSFTMLFGYPIKPPTACTDPKKVIPVAPSTSGPTNFTMIFGAPSKPPTAKVSALKAAEAGADVRPAQAPPAVGAFTEIFGAPAVPKPTEQAIAKVPTTEASAKDFEVAFTFSLKDKSSVPEKVTKPATSELATILNRGASVSLGGPQEKDTGAITRLFNSVPTPISEKPQSQPTNDFDKLFSSTPEMSRSTSVSGTEAAVPSILREVARKPTQFSLDAPPSGATQIFTRPSMSAVPAAVPAGPSEFTQVISAAEVNAMMLKPASTAAVMRPESLALQAPPVSYVPASPVPPVLSAPARLPIPQIPAVAANPRPNWMPVIIGANVFLAIVMILILVFALKR
jgi:hypothetical protein